MYIYIYIYLPHIDQKTPRVNSGRGMWHEDTYLTKLYKTSLVQTVLSLHSSLTLPKFNIAPEKWWLEDYFPGAVKLREGNPKCSRPTITLPPAPDQRSHHAEVLLWKPPGATEPHIPTKTNTQRRINWTYTRIINHAYIHNHMHNILYIVYIYIYLT